jgi:enamine deaminase RidA (YjgF/YER057c/UK114 family)
MSVTEIKTRDEESATPRGLAVAEELSGVSGRISKIDLEGCCRMAIVVASSGRGDFGQQARELISHVQAALDRQSLSMRLTSQTVFLQDPSKEPVLRELLSAAFGPVVTTFVHQSPCCGAALALEAWAIGGPGVRVEHLGRHAVALTYGGARWVHCGDLHVADHPEGVYAQTGLALQRMRKALNEAGTDLQNVVRTWFYLGGITDPEGDTQRYKELNRARTDFYKDISFQDKLLLPDPPQGIYPASTGIGMDGRSLVGSCLSVQTDEKGARLVALENPQQTPAYAYHPKYSPQSPKFSRAMALAIRRSVTTWISGTASIVNSESKHDGNPERQTEQTLDNIEKLISSENFKFHGLKGAGLTLNNLAKVRVYVKHAEHLKAVRGVCERRFGLLPIIYAVADVCRPELLVEIEGVAFSQLD